MKSLVGTYERDEFGNPIYVFKETGPDHFAHARAYAEIALPLGSGASHEQGRKSLPVRVPR